MVKGRHGIFSRSYLEEPRSVCRVVGNIIEKEVSLDTLVLYHIPKTAGTTITLALIEEFSDDIWNAQSQSRVEAEKESLKSYFIVSGHFKNDFVYGNFEKKNVLTILRDPLKRAVSQYENWRDVSRIEWDSDAWTVDEVARQAFEIAQTSTAYDFLSHKENYEVVANTRNVLTRALCSEPDVDPFTTDERLVEDAFENLRSFLWFGFVEQLDVSMAMLARQLRRPRLLDGALYKHNPSSRRNPLSQAEKTAVRKINALDYKLFDLAKGEFERRKQIFFMDGIRRTTEADYADFDLWRFSEFAYQPDDLVFLNGWSFPEADGAGQAYRWSFGATRARLAFNMPSQPPAGPITLLLSVLAVSSDIDPDQLDCELGGVRAAQSKWKHEEGRFEFEFSFDAGAIKDDIQALDILVPGLAPNPKPDDPRDHLGIAFAGIRIRIRSS